MPSSGNNAAGQMPPPTRAAMPRKHRLIISEEESLSQDYRPRDRFEKGTVLLCRTPFFLVSLRPLRLCAKRFGLELRAEAQRPQRQAQTFSTKQDSPLFGPVFYGADAPRTPGIFRSSKERSTTSKAARGRPNRRALALSCANRSGLRTSAVILWETVARLLALMAAPFSRR